MLGARARAAEYNAYKAASARQASREAEEQRLPPESVPVSLSAFSKNTVSNRNKGNKTWIPLVLDNIDDDASSLEDEANLSPTLCQKQEKENDMSGTVSENSAIPSSNANIRVRMPQVLTSVPKSIHPMIEPPGITTNPQTHPQPGVSWQISKLNNMNTFPSHEWSVGGLAFQNSPWPSALPYFCETDPVHNSHQESILPYGDGIPPGFSPTKQEQKFSRFPQGHQSSYAIHNNPHINNHQNTLFGPFPLEQMTQRAFEFNTHGPWEHSYRSNGLTPLSHQSDTSMTRNRSLQQSALRESSPGYIGRPVWAQPPPKISRAIPIQAPPRLNENEEPYDRNTKMQTFVATQQALAKTGKTVLHNPELDKTSKLDIDSLRGDNSPATSSAIITNGNGVEVVIETERSIRKAPKIPPGLSLPAIGHRTWIDNSTTVPDAIHDDQLRQRFNVGSEDWYELRIPSSEERKRMLDTITQIALKMNSIKGQQVNAEDSNDRKTEALRWLHMARGPPKAKPTTNTENSTRSGSFRALNDVLTNLIEHTDEQTLPPGERDYFCNYKPAPDFAIERTGLLMNKTGSTSYFEQNNGEFFSAPVRIARDPRFRLQGKEITKVRLDDDWTRQNDLYGRRRI